MNCPRCDKAARVLETRMTSGIGIRRRRRCTNTQCDYAFTTLEVPVETGLPAHTARELRSSIAILKRMLVNVSDDAPTIPVDNPLTR